MKRYIRSSKAKATWEKQSSTDYSLYIDNDWLVSVHKRGNIWEISTSSFNDTAYSLLEAKRNALKLVADEAEDHIEWLQHQGYTDDGIKDYGKSDPYIRYIGY